MNRGPTGSQLQELSAACRASLENRERVVLVLFRRVTADAGNVKAPYILFCFSFIGERVVLVLFLRKTADAANVKAPYILLFSFSHFAKNKKSPPGKQNKTKSRTGAWC